jgi:TonB family protein
MFNNLIESSSHAREFKRRGSFVLFTTTTYVALFIVAGVISIYAYDARLSDPRTEQELLSFVLPEPYAPRVIADPVKIRRGSPPTGVAESARSTRPVLVDQTNNPLNPPPEVSSIASPFPPAHVGTERGPVVLEPPGSGSAHDGGDSNSNGSRGVVVKAPEPPPLPPPAPTPKRIVTSPTILNGRALQLPKPPYPRLAKIAGAQGPVNVQVLVDETGKVISAKAVSGNPLLRDAAQQAALEAHFSPTMLGDQAVKVSGVIIYNFVLH